MHDEFQAMVGKVWARLGLPAPTFREPGRIRLRIEAMGVDLWDSGTGLMIVEGSAGRIGPDPLQRARQTRRILDSNLGLLVGSDAAVYVKRTPSGDASLAVRSSCAYRGGSLDRLVKKIEDVMQVMEYYAGDLTMAGAPPAPKRAEEARGFEQAMIFRP